MVLNVYGFGPVGGQPLVALHGLKGHGRRWQSLADRQLPGLRVHAPDLRGHGFSTTEPPWTLEQHAQDVLAVMDHFGLDRVPVAGHSFGGTVATYLARHAPERVDRLILLDPGIELPPRRAEARAQEALHAPTFDNPHEAARQRAGFWPPEAHELVSEEVDNHLARGEDGRWRWRYSIPVAVTAYSELARPAVTPPPQIPTLLVVARRYQAVSADYPDACRAALGDRFSVVELDCGHHVHLERADEVGRLIRDFLAPYSVPRCGRATVVR